MPHANPIRQRRRWGIAIAVAAVAVPAVALAPAASAQPADGPAAPAAQPRIVGGQPADIGEHPYTVYLTDRTGAQFCGGTLIAADAVVTAGHCAAAMSPTDIRVVAGRQDTGDNDGSTSRVTGAWTPPGYSSPEKGRDIAVLHLADRLPAETAALPDSGVEDMYAEGTEATVLGWGRTSEGGEQSATLRGAVVPITSDATCGEAYGDYDRESMVCAGYPEGGVDACQGDSGGPLMVNGTLIGVVSWGEGCARPGKPGVYTRVSTYAADILREAESQGADR